MFELPEGVVDAWINPNLGGPLTDGNDVSYLFPELGERLERGTTLEQLIDEMDEAGVAQAVLCSGYSGTGDLDWALAARNKYPDRFRLSHVIDPREGMKAVRLAEELVRSEDYRLIRMLGLQTRLAYNDAAYYPVYAKCVELGVPVGLNVGFPGPQVPSKYQDPLAVDDVAAFFPELTIILQHGGEPWVDTCVKLMVKWPGIHYMTSAIAPKHIPPAIIAYANTRGADRVMFASDYPLLTHERCVRELRELPFRDSERFAKFVGGNAGRLFFGH
ncbi:amidohydrolase family protein [Mycolicibacterium sp. CBMA 234]|uniref:amidohydrolase family protein n=1 Tax=Mycolicibacterium sp. CBMA 234 TaxID=1918495 RepID=UPI0028164DF1|nr:amidohydrolase family protein [Mycolicibacterium sp. CBMA 234]